ncbi:Transmembrane channel-like protein 8 [Saguinus oedipus]|uniref:Transmembrane channel-like protein 8 n=1 Tax=Saguinus oedipus TaxID=9490 RepID=A0ABQ9VTJ4_SAGOE|nr:Transmembrane channel-like protein 8 [Saguinus oedipus]
MLRPQSVPSEQGPGGLELEELWEAEMERLRCSGAPVRGLPYAMMDKRLIWRLREPAGKQTLRWQRWQRRRQTVERRLREAAQRLARGLGLWEGALYEIGGLFGTGIQSYFTFLRFLLLLNLLSLLPTASFVLLPLAWLSPPDPGPALNLSKCAAHQGKSSSAHLRHRGLAQGPERRDNPGHAPAMPGQGPLSLTPPCVGHTLAHLQRPAQASPPWGYGAALTNTYLFYGAYRLGPESSSGYSIRLAYLLSPLACLLLCFCGTLQR